MTSADCSAPSFADLLRSAVTEPGILSAAYRQFHAYSIGNQLLAWSQCLTRGIRPGPMATFPKWQELGRHVRKDEKAITLCQPVTIKRLADAEIHFTDGPLDGLKLIGLGIWERRTGGGRNVTFPARAYSVNGERRSFSLLRPIADTTAQDRIRDLILEAFAAYEEQTVRS